ncbi:MAG: YidC/Oxa1 family insertase periplasmic-domain containing protein [Phycisphaerales bacterium]|jgi:YidC/Oxa1 family membrane protein insertase|nr:YidC/Oxa1 family insertase periplasmic-domain containing protein [Phycisphaerales bacterium]
MTKKAKRRLIPLIVMLASTGVLATIVFGPGRNTKEETSGVETPPVAVENTHQASHDAPDSITETPVAPAESPAKTKPSVSESTETPTETPKAVAEGTLSLKLYGGEDTTTTLGALDNPQSTAMEIEFTRAGAGIKSIRFSNIFETVDGKLAWNKYRRDGGVQPPIDDLYLLTTSHDLSYNTNNGVQTASISALGASQITINGELLHVTSPSVWKSTGAGSFEATVVDAGGNDVATIVRKWTFDNRYGLHLDQKVHNLTSSKLTVTWLQYGPPSLRVDRSRYMDRRRFRFGWELNDAFDPNHAAPIQSSDFLYEYADAAKVGSEPLWPTTDTREEGLKLSWFASTNRYFALAVYPNINDQGVGPRLLKNTVQVITAQTVGEESDQFILTALWSPETTVEANGSLDLTMGVYAGPLQRSVLDTEQPYVSLAMRGMVLYQMSSMCAICTFQWLADFLAMVLTTLDHYVVFDWGLAIILLVLIVRTLLHPITKKSQINMQRFGKVMQKLKPEIDKLKSKYPNDPKKVQAEQMALMQKHGVNPFQMLGCLPMFLQMPIWVALYALLYFMFDIRQEPAFFGFFQFFGDWPFLADLSASDHFFGAFSEPKQFLMWNVTGINLLPILMGVIFFIQQKYMSPQTGAAMTPEQQSQQKIMRVMMVVLFPVMLYSAPSGLTLYILTSSAVGILESRHIRKHVDQMDFEPKTPPTGGKNRKPKDKQGRAWADAMEARRKKVKNKAKKRSFKKKG